MPKVIKPLWTTPDKVSGKLFLGDVNVVLAALPERSVHTVITSPPYWGLRDYGVTGQIGSEPLPDCGTRGQAQCSRCFVCSMVRAFRGVRRVLRDDGTVWLNLGDLYSTGSGGKTPSPEVYSGEFRQGRAPVVAGLGTGNLVGVPWRVALALQADGWILRQDIIWAKPAPMPESVRNRCTKAHEYIFLLAKNPGYFYDAEAIKVNSIDPESLNGRNPRNEDAFTQAGVKAEYRGGFSKIEEGRTYPTSNKRSVWRVAGASYKGAHFATFPEKLITPCVLAGTSAKGCCAECGAPWKRVVEEEKLTRDRPNDYVKRAGAAGTGNSCGNTVAGVAVETVGWEPTCGCGTDEVVPCTVLDPFIGSGTTGVAAAKNGRRCWGIDLSEEYLRKHAVVRWCSVAYYWDKMDQRA